MSTYHAPLADMRFVLFDLLDAEAVFARLGFADATRDVLDAVLDEAARFSETVLAPLNKVGDETGCRFDPSTGAVATPPGFREAYETFVEGGWSGLVSPPDFGGQGMPYTAGTLLKEMIDAANLAWGNFPLLSHGATDALIQHGEDWQREVFLRPLVEGRWTGTMCLTEPHCGTDLGLLKTKAEPDEDGSYSITGTKIFITAGEHDLTDNIVHLVLAKLPDAPAGSRGISLFLVPKFKVARDLEFRHQEQRDAATAGGRVRQLRQHQVDDVVGEVVLAGGDEDLGAGDRIAAVFVRLRLRLQQPEVGAAMRLGQAHRAGPAPLDQRPEEHLALPVLAVLDQRIGGAVRQQREVAPGQVGRVDHFLQQGAGGVRHALAAEVRRRDQPAPAAFDEGFVRLAEAGRGGDGAGRRIEAAPGFIADLVERRQHRFAEARRLVQHRVEHVAGGVGEAQAREHRLRVEQVEQHEAHVGERCVVGAHGVGPGVGESPRLGKRIGAAARFAQRSTPGRPGTGFNPLLRSRS